jgi:hypothetical protein
VSLGDFVRGFFSKRRNPHLRKLEPFIATHRGVEGYIEPRTATQSTTLLLVDREGESVRAPVREPEDAVAFCDHHSIPVYDAAVIGYPKRMRPDEGIRDRPRSEDVDEQIADLERRLRDAGGSGTPDR